MKGFKLPSLPGEYQDLFMKIFSHLDGVSNGIATMTEGQMRIQKFKNEEIRLSVISKEEGEFESIQQIEWIEYNFEESILDATTHILFKGLVALNSKAFFPIYLEYDGELIDCNLNAISDSSKLSSMELDLDSQTEAGEVIKDYLENVFSQGIRLRDLR